MEDACVGNVRDALRLFPHRWPIIVVAPAFYAGGYTWMQVIALTVLVAALAELAFAIAKVLLLDREY